MTLVVLFTVFFLFLISYTISLYYLSLAWCGFFGTQHLLRVVRFPEHSTRLMLSSLRHFQPALLSRLRLVRHSFIR